MLVTTIIDVGLIISFQILGDSMMADLVEQAQLKTGRRAEGVFFSATSFTQTLVSGVGVTAAGFVLAAAAFPTGADPSPAYTDALWRLGAYCGPLIRSLCMARVAGLSY